MCAISGCLHFQNKGFFSIEPLLKSMAHRGPDETNWIDEDLWSIGFNRLAVTSVHEKNTQPLWSPDKRFCFVFNGEIYNYKTIKKDLEEKKYQFKTSCDAEVLFYAYLEYGIEAFLKCQGMFAMALFDNLEKKWVLVRDPLGIKPLYFQMDQNRFVFSSEIKPLLILKKPEMNKKVLPHYLQKRFVLGKETLFSNIFRLQPGELMAVSLKKDIKTIKYYKPKLQNHRNKKERFKKFSIKLKESVQLSSESETGKAILLSGGLDSSLINALIYSFNRKSSPNINSIPSAWFFDNTYDVQERIFTKRLTQKMSQKLNTIYSNKKDFLLLPKIIQALEEPLGDSVTIPTYKLMKQVSQTNKVALSGEGADELLGGYSHHWLFYFLKKFQFLTSLSIEKFFPESLLNTLFPYPGKFNKNRLLKLLDQIRNKGLKRYLEMTHLFNSEEIKELFPDLLEESGFSENFYPDIQSLKDLIKFDLENWLPNYNLLRIDKLSMAHSLEVRVPYLNLDFVNACLNLPQTDIISLFVRKKILRTFSYKESYLDFKTSYRKKHPFTIKEDKVYKKEYKDFIGDHLDSSFRKKWNINTKALDRLLNKDLQYLENQKQITSLLNLSIWTKSFFE